MVVFKFVGFPSSGPVPEGLVNVAATLQVAVSSPDELRGRPELLTPEKMNLAPKKQLTFKLIEEPWNYYALPEAPGQPRFVKVKLTVVGIWRVTDHFDAEGNPMYTLNTGINGGPATREEIEAAWKASFDRA